VEVSDNVQAGISVADTVCDGNLVNFTDNSTITSGTIDTYFWDFGDGSTSNAQNPSHTYAAPGNYTITHTVGSAGGCTSSTTFDVTITAMPTASFIEMSTCQNGITSFADMSSISS